MSELAKFDPNQIDTMGISWVPIHFMGLLLRRTAVDGNFVLPAKNSYKFNQLLVRFYSDPISVKLHTSYSF